VVWQWGDTCTSTKGNDLGSIEEKLRPKRVPLYAKAKNVFAGACCSFAVLGDGSVYAWGLDNFGQLGVEANGRDPHADQWVFPPRMVACNFGKGTIRDIKSAEQHTLFLTSNGRVFACGCHHYGRLGIRGIGEDVKTPREISNPKTTSRITNRYVAIAAGQLHSVAITKSGDAFAWGCGDDLQLGTGKEDEEKVPVELLGIQLKGDKSRDVPERKALAVACGFQHTAFIACTRHQDEAQRRPGSSRKRGREYTGDEKQSSMKRAHTNDNKGPYVPEINMEQAKVDSPIVEDGPTVSVRLTPQGKPKSLKRFYSQKTPLRLKSASRLENPTDMWIKENFDVESMFRDVTEGSPSRTKMQERLARIKDAKEKLMSFYANFAPNKTLDDINRIIMKYSKSGDDWFTLLSDKLHQKYNARP